ncbi:hypothetical protein OE165_28265, partial [Escherichia coli]|uniref:hypothetical protein n=1 Tax=Escherichia coli TaxID=562 RepID=UPI0021F27242
FQWSKDSGIGISFDFQNYMEPLRNQGQRVTPSTGANRTPPRMSNNKDAPQAGKTMTFTIAEAEGKE